jgi:hypothetical protein
LNLVDDTPIVPGDVHPPFSEIEAARQVLTDAEDDLRRYQLDVEPIHSTAGNLGLGAMPGSATATGTSVPESIPTDERTIRSESPVDEGQYDTAGSAAYPLAEADRVERQEQVPRQEVSNAV